MKRMGTWMATTSLVALLTGSALAGEAVLRKYFVGTGKTWMQAWENAQAKVETRGAIAAVEAGAAFLGENFMEAEGKIKDEVMVGGDGTSMQVSERVRAFSQKVGRVNFHPPRAQYEDPQQLKEMGYLVQEGGMWTCTLPVIFALDDASYANLFEDVQALKAVQAQAEEPEVSAEIEALESAEPAAPTDPVMVAEERKVAKEEGDAQAPAGEITGVIIDASDEKKFRQNNWPILWGKGKKEGWDIYSPSVFDAKKATGPYVAYAYSLAEARQNTDRIGANPAVVTPQKVYKKEDLLLSKKDAAFLLTLEEKSGLLSAGKILIVVRAK